MQRCSRNVNGEDRALYVGQSAFKITAQSKENYDDTICEVFDCVDAQSSL